MLYLTVRFPNGKNSYHTIEDPEISVGRHQEVLLRLDEENVSQRHARIFYENEMYWCEDGWEGQASLNGTWINGKRVSEPVPLEKGDTLLIGSCQIQVNEISKSLRSTQEMKFLQGKDVLDPEDWHALQLRKLDRRIHFQSWKIGACVLIFLAVGFSVAYFFWSQRVAVDVSPVTCFSPENRVFVFSSTARAMRTHSQESPIDGQVSKIYKKIGQLVLEKEPLLQIRNGDVVNVQSAISGRLHETPGFLWEAGSKVRAREPICGIVDNSTMHVFFEIPEEQFPGWEVGQELAPIKFPAIPKLTFSGTVEGVFFNDQSGIEVAVEIENPADLIQPGMEARFERVLPVSGSGFLIPKSCLVPKLPYHAVYLVQGQRCWLRKLQVSENAGKNLLVSGGLHEDDLVIVSPPENLEDGRLVVVRKR